MPTPTTDSDAPDTTTLAPRSTGADIAFGLSADNWEHAYKMAKVIAESELIPKAYRGKPPDVVVAMQMGAEVGLSPMAALQSIRVINGQPGLYGDGFLAVIQSAPRYVKHVEYYVTAQGEQVDHVTQQDLKEPETKAVSKFWRKGVAEPFVGTFSIADAQRAHLIGKEGPWQEYTQRQLLWRARGFAGRNGFAAELRGMKILAELEDLPDDRDERDEARPRPVMPIRRSEKPAEPTDTTFGDRAAVRELEQAPSPSTKPAGGPSRQPAGKRAAPSSGSSATSSEATAANPEVYETMVITDTSYIEDAGEGYYKITAKQENAPLAFDFITRDKSVGELAESAAGAPQTFSLKYRTWKRPGKPPVKELLAIVAS